MKVTAKFGFALTFVLVATLWLGAQSASDQPQTPAQEPAAQEKPETELPKQEAPQTPPAPPEQAPSSQGQSEAPQQAEPPKDANVPVLKHRPKTAHKKAASPAPSSGKVVVRNGGAKGGTPELAPGSSGEQQQHQRESTNQLLATTDANVKSVAGRPLTPAQKSMMEQVRAYVSQAKAASDSGDLDRAHTLAYKAHLLSDELAKK
jgi:outer membrane biosynthesis protein TonB